MNIPLVILGAGAHGVDILECVLQAGELYRPLGFLDDQRTTPVQGFPILGPLSQATSMDNEVRFVTAIGNAKSYLNKPALLESLNINDQRYINIIHSSASVSPWAQIGSGCVILQQCTLSAGAKLGNQVLLLPGCRISHDSVVEDHNILATGVILSGHVHVESNCYLGAGAVVKERLRLGRGCLVGMGSVVLRSTNPGEKVVGNPARTLPSP